MTVDLAANEGNETEQEAEEFTRAVQAVLLAVEE